jgi:hypothetical protein
VVFMTDKSQAQGDAPAFAYHFDVDITLISGVQRELLRRSRWYRGMQYGYALIPIPFIILNLASGQAFLRAIINSLFWIIAAPVFGFGVVPWLNRWGLSRQIRANPILAGPRTLTLRQDGLGVETQGGQSLIRWASFLRIAETSLAFLFYYAPGCAHYLPRAAVPVQQLPDLRSFIRSHVAVPTDFQSNSEPTSV